MLITLLKSRVCPSSCRRRSYIILISWRGIFELSPSLSLSLSHLTYHQHHHYHNYHQLHPNKRLDHDGWISTRSLNATELVVKLISVNDILFYQI